VAGKKKTELIQIEREPWQFDMSSAAHEPPKPDETIAWWVVDEFGEWVRHSTGPIEQPEKIWINDTGELVKEYKSGRLEGKIKGTSRYRQLGVQFPQKKAKRNTKPTQIISLLTQNPSGGSRPASTFFWWKQPDEDYYIAHDKRALPEHLAESRENYYLVEETSIYRLRFVCPDSGGGPAFNPYPLYVGSRPQAPASIGPILIYVNPANGQASWICPKCTYFNSKERGGDGHAVMHTISPELREELARGGIIPQTHIEHEADELYHTICKNPGSSYYELDKLMNWDSDGDKSQRIINRYLADKVKMVKGRKKKGYKIYPKYK